MKPSAGSRIPDYIVLALFVATLIASGCIRWLGNWEEHRFWLNLTWRILWGVWLVAVLATALTKATIFGWSFRRYFRWPEQEPPPPTAPRPTRAPWTKSPAASFSFTVSLVSVTGAIGLTLLVLWILEDVIGKDAFIVIFRILAAVWWVVVITLVLIRVSMFGVARKHGLAQKNQNSAPPEPPQENPSKETLESRT